MTTPLTTAQIEELRALLIERRAALQTQLHQLTHAEPTSADAMEAPQRNAAREVTQALTDIEAADLARIERALEAIAHGGAYGQCDECGCTIAFERLRIEPQTQHCVACKSRWEEATGHAHHH